MIGVVTPLLNTKPDPVLYPVTVPLALMLVPMAPRSNGVTVEPIFVKAYETLIPSVQSPAISPESLMALA